MLQQAMRKGNRARAQSVPAPVGGWNARDALDMMKPEDAVKLINWYPEETSVSMRKGYSEHSDTGETAACYTIAALEAGTVNKLVVACNGKFFDVSTSSPSSIASSLSGSDWVHTQFGNKLFFVNGTNVVQAYDGSSWTTPAFTGVTLTDLNYVTSFKSRLYFIEKNSLSFWYGGVDAVAGALTEFALDEVGTTGGKLDAILTIPVDAGDGADDLFVAITTTGEALVYSGSNPGSDFTLLGRFRCGRLVDRKAWAKVEADVIMVTMDGARSLSSVLQIGRSKRGLVTDKIAKAMRYATESYGSNSGWQVLYYPMRHAVWINVPVTAAVADQYVLNLTTGAWCRFRNQQAGSWAIYSDLPYFGSLSGIVYKADTGTSDDGAVIACDAQTAWNYFGSRANQKRFTMYRPILSSTDTPPVVAAIGVDFDTQIATDPISADPVDSDAVWDTAVWDTAIWTGGQLVSRSWESLTGIGYCASMRLRCSTADQQVSWQATNYIFEPGGLI